MSGLQRLWNSKTKQRVIFILIASMCLIRFGLAFIAYIKPSFLMLQLGFPLELNLQAPYLGRVWAVRDMVISGLVIYAFFRKWLNPLLVACIIIDTTDILSAYLGGEAGLFNQKDTISLMLTAVVALVPETIALILNLQRASNVK